MLRETETELDARDRSPQAPTYGAVRLPCDIGKKPVHTVTAADVLAVLRRIEARETHHMAHASGNFARR